MGKKTRTRRTKWRRLSLGDASGPEEDDDEPQTCADQQQPESTTPSATPSTDEQIVLVPGAEVVEEELCDSVVPVAITATNVVIMPGHQSDETALSQSQPPLHHQQRSSGWKPPAKAQQAGYYANANGRQSTATQATLAQSNSATGQQQSNGYRRANSSGQRYNGSSSGGYNGGGGGYNGSNGYGRANSWNTNGSYDHHHSHHHSQQPGGLSKTHGIEKKIFNDEEYTKISTPRQEVLFKKGSIGAKKRLPATATPAATAETAAPATPVVSSPADDNGNASSSPTLSPPSSASAAGLNSEADCFQYSGINDSGSTGDASSTAGEMVGADGAALSGYGDGAPLVCIPMYDFYGAYGGMYPGSTMLVQTYPGGPLVAAVPVPMPLYTGANPGGAGSGVGGTAGGSHEMTTAFYYALGYPAAAGAGGGELATSPYDAASHGSRRNSLESYQASSTQEVMTMSETSSSSSSSSASENNSPCSTGPSSQGPASPQGELVSAPIDAKAQAAAAASAMALLDLNSHHHNNHHQRLGNQGKMAVAGFVYPAYPYGLAPPALYASAGCDDVAAAAAFFYDNPSTEYYYDDDGLLVAVDDGQAGMFCDQIGEEDDDNGNQLMAMTVAEEDVDVEVTPVVLQPKEEPPILKPVVAIQPVVSGRRKKKRKRRNKRAGSSQPQRVTDDVAADNDDEDGEEEEEEEVEEPVVSVSSISPPPPSQPTATCDSLPASLTAEVEEIIVDASPKPSTTPTAAAEKEAEASLEVSPPSLLQPESATSIESNQVSCSSTTTTHCLPPSPVSNTLLVLSEPLTSSVDEILPESSGRLTQVDQPPSTESVEQKPSNDLQCDPVSPDFSLPCSSSSSSSPIQVDDDEVQSLSSDNEAVLVILSETLSAAVDEENEELLSIESDSLASAEQPLLRPDSKAMDRDSLDQEEEEDSNNEVDDDDARDDFVQLHLPDEEFDHEPLLSRQVQLWRTVILEESEPESKELSIHSSMDGINDDSGIAVCNNSSPLSACLPAEQGPISKAVSQWLESAPIQQQLIASTSSLLEDEQDEANNDDDLSEDEDENKKVPKNGLFDPCTAPSSEQSFTDGPQLRVDSVEPATGGDLLQEAEEEPLDRPLGPDCSPAKFSKYYQLGVTLEEDGEGEQLIKPEDAIQPCPLEAVAEAVLVGEQAAATDSASNDPKKKTKKDGTTKRSSKWRRILLARRAVHNNKTDKTNKGLRSGQSCCAVQ